MALEHLSNLLEIYTRWFHEFIYNKKNVEIRFLKGRLKFGDANNSAPFPSMIVVFRGKGSDTN